MTLFLFQKFLLVFFVLGSALFCKLSTFANDDSHDDILRSVKNKSDKVDSCQPVAIRLNLLN